MSGEAGKLDSHTTETSSRNDRTPPKIENPQKQNTRKFNTRHCNHHNQLERSESFGKYTIFPPFKGLKAAALKETRKLVVPVIII